MSTTSNNSHLPALSLIALSLATILGSAAQAQNVTLLPQTIVSASAVSQNAVSVGSSVTVVTQEDIQKNGYTTVKQALRQLSGVVLSSNGPVGNASVLLRGHDNKDLAVVIDGVKVNDISGSDAGFDFANLSIANIEKIEVLKGSQSAIWGSDAIAGVIHITTSGADKDGLSARVFGNYGSHNTANFGFGVGYKTDKADFYVDALQYQTDGGVSAQSSNTEEDGAKTTDYGIKGDVTLGNGFSADLGYRHQNQDQDYDGFGTTTDVVDAKRDNGHFAITHEKDLFKNSLRASTAKTERDYYAKDGDATPSYGYTGKEKTISLKGSAGFEQADNLHEVIYDLSKSDREIVYHQGTFNSKEFNKTDDHKEAAVEYRYTTANDSSVSAAVRHQDSDTFGSATTYRLAGSYNFDNGGRVHSSIGSGVKNPSLYQLYDQYSGNSALTPEKSVSVDLGYEHQFNDDLVADITLFNSTIDNSIDYDFTSYRFEQSKGETKRKGVELSGKAQFDDLGLNANYTYTKATDSEGKAEVRRPKHSASIGADYQLNKNLNLNANVIYKGKRPDIGDKELPAYTTVDLASQYQVNDNFSLSASIKNVTDKKYDVANGYNTLGRTLNAGFDYKY